VSAIAAVHTRRLRMPLLRPWGRDVRENHLIVTELSTEDGEVGLGFSWTPTVGAGAVRALLDEDLIPRALGMPADAEAVWDELWVAVHEAGGGGVTTIALAGVDLALWDLAARRAGRSLADLLGVQRDSVPVYGSGINLHYPLEELVAQTERFEAAGHFAVKMKVGRPDLAEDIERVRAVRDVLGPDRPLMIDANQRWDVDTALRAIDALAPFGLEWLEEPLRADDLTGYRVLSARTDVPIALGENVHTVHRFRDFLEAGAVQVAQPNVVRVGGITPFRRIVALAESYGVRVAPHLLPELSGQLALTMPGSPWVELVEDASFAVLGVLEEPAPVTIDSGVLRQTGALGLGLVFSGADRS
jgi:L-alanine-DL-glutamate epimerase-like enolase superfamily enzyme